MRRDEHRVCRYPALWRRWRCRYRLRNGLGLGNCAFVVLSRGAQTRAQCCVPQSVALSHLFAIYRCPCVLHPQGWGSKIIDTKQKFPRKGESLLESAQAAAASAMSALHPDATTDRKAER